MPFLSSINTPRKKKDKTITKHHACSLQWLSNFLSFLIWFSSTVEKGEFSQLVKNVMHSSKHISYPLDTKTFYVSKTLQSSYPWGKDNIYENWTWIVRRTAYHNNKDYQALPRQVPLFPNAMIQLHQHKVEDSVPSTKNQNAPKISWDHKIIINCHSITYYKLSILLSYTRSINLFVRLSKGGHTWFSAPIAIAAAVAITA